MATAMATAMAMAMAMANEIGAGRAFYTAMGHRDSTYEDANFRAAITGGINWVGGRD